MGYDRDDSIPFDLERNIESYAIQFERKWKSSFLSVCYEKTYVF